MKGEVNDGSAVFIPSPFSLPLQSCVHGQYGGDLVIDDSCSLFSLDCDEVYDESLNSDSEGLATGMEAGPAVMPTHVTFNQAMLTPPPECPELAMVTGPIYLQSPPLFQPTPGVLGSPAMEPIENQMMESHMMSEAEFQDHPWTFPPPPLSHFTYL